jgi:hypothetical protein
MSKKDIDFPAYTGTQKQRQKAVTWIQNEVESDKIPFAESIRLSGVSITTYAEGHLPDKSCCYSLLGSATRVDAFLLEVGTGRKANTTHLQRILPKK